MSNTTLVFDQYSSVNFSFNIIYRSSATSGTYKDAKVSTKDLPNTDNPLIDTYTITLGSANLVFLANNLLESREDDNLIVDPLYQREKPKYLNFMVDTLENNKKG